MEKSTLAQRRVTNNKSMNKKRLARIILDIVTVVYFGLLLYVGYVIADWYGVALTALGIAIGGVILWAIRNI